MTVIVRLRHPTPPNGQQQDALESLQRSLGDHTRRKIIVEDVDMNGNVLKMNIKYASFSTLSRDFAAWFPALEELFFYNCKRLKDVSPLSAMKTLTGLILMSCRIPETIGDLVFLKILEVYHQQVPRSIGNLVNLQTLIFRCFETTELPREMGKIHSLKELNLGYCAKLKTIPASVLKLPQLEKLRLRGCNNLRIPCKDIIECSDSLVEVTYPTTMDEETKEVFDLVIRWNKAGRRLLGKPNVKESLWARVLGRCSHDKDCLLFFLKQKPDLCSSAAGRKRKHNA